MDMRKYFDAVIKEIEEEKARAEVLKNEDAAYLAYLNKCALKINRFLEGSGSDVRYNPDSDSDFVEFITNAFEYDSKEQKAMIEFVRTLPKYKYEYEIPHSSVLESYKIFLSESVPCDLTRKDFPSEDVFRMYEQHVCAATSDDD